MPEQESTPDNTEEGQGIDPTDLDDFDPTNHDSYTSNVARALITAHENGTEKLGDVPEGDYDAIVGIGHLDGRKRFVKRFKRLANQVGANKWVLQDSDYPFELNYDVGREMYTLQHKYVDGATSLQRKLAAYEEMKNAIQKFEIAGEARTYNRPLSEA